MAWPCRSTRTLVGTGFWLPRPVWPRIPPVCACERFFCIIARLGVLVAHLPAPASRARSRDIRPRLRPEAPADLRRGFLISKARWQSGHAAACKAVYAGSIPTLASIATRPISHSLGVFAQTCRFTAAAREPQTLSKRLVRRRPGGRNHPITANNPFPGRDKTRRYTPASTLIGDADALLCSPP